MPTSSATGMPRTSEAIAVAIVIPADGPSFGTAPAGTWMWTSCSENQSSVEAQLLRVRAHPRERGLRRLPHHVAELSGDRERALARVRGRLDEEDVAADGRVGEAGGDPGLGGALARVGREAARPEPLAGPGLVDLDARRAVLGDLARRLAAQVGDSPFEVADARLARVLADDDAQDVVAGSRAAPRSGRAPRAASARGTCARSRASRPRCSRRAGSRPSGRAAGPGSSRAGSPCR